MYAVSIHRDGLALLSQIGDRAKAFRVLISLARLPVHFTFPTLTSFTETCISMAVKRYHNSLYDHLAETRLNLLFTDR